MPVSLESTVTDKKLLAMLIYEHVEDMEYKYHNYPMHGLVPDYFLAYVELSRLVRAYFGNTSPDSYHIDTD